MIAGVSDVQRYKMIVAYRGTHYHGWAHQEVPPTWKKKVDPPDKFGTGGLPTIYRALAQAIQHVVRHPVAVVGSSRTDTGVHGKAQLAHFDTTQLEIPNDGLRRAINHQLPDDILVRDLEAVSFDFHAIRSTTRKRYQYLIWHAEDRPPFLAGYCWHRWQELDVPAMREGAAYLVGEHDFTSFAKAGHGRRSAVRTIYGIDIAYRPPRLVIGIEGNGFLWNMVRIIVGTLVAVGLGHVKPEDVKQMLEAKDRRAARGTAPASGLYLQWIKTDGVKSDDAGEEE